MSDDRFTVRYQTWLTDAERVIRERDEARAEVERLRQFAEWAIEYADLDGDSHLANQARDALEAER
jgi:hypothetical protein